MNSLGDEEPVEFMEDGGDVVKLLSSECIGVSDGEP